MPTTAPPTEVTSPFQLAALDASDVGTWEVDLIADQFRGDGVTASIFGLSVEESIAGVPLGRAAEMVHPADRTMWRARREPLLRHGGMFVVEYRVLSKRGEIRWVLVRGRYDIELGGCASRGRGIVIDLTESKRDGFAEGNAVFVDQSEGCGQTVLEQAAVHALGAHRAISNLAGLVDPALQVAADRLLEEAGLAIAKSRAPASDPKRH